MTYQVSRARRWFVSSVVTAAICAMAALAVWLIGSSHVHFLGLDVANSLRGATYLSATAMVVTTGRWLHLARRRSKRITVRELRRRARGGT